MKRFTTGAQTIGVGLSHQELDEDPDLFYRMLDKCRRVMYKVDIVPQPGGVHLRSAHAWEHHQEKTLA